MANRDRGPLGVMVLLAHERRRRQKGGTGGTRARWRTQEVPARGLRRGAAAWDREQARGRGRGRGQVPGMGTTRVN